MLRLRPLSETTSGKELIKEERIALLIQLCQRKFALSDEVVASVNLQLQKLEMATLKELFSVILDFNALEQLEQWITDHLPVKRKKTAGANRGKSN